MPAMQLSLFDDADFALVVAPDTTARARRSTGSARSTGPPLAERIARVGAATPRVAEIARLLIPAWPDADVEVD